MKDTRIAVSRVFATVLTLALTMGAASAAAAATVLVVNNNNAGPGSFRGAVNLANANPAIDRIRILPFVNAINLQSTVHFTGPQDLTIEGTGATLDGTNASGPAFAIGDPITGGGGGDLTVVSLTVRNAPDHGIVYYVPGSAAGTLRVNLLNVTIRGNAGHGVWIADQVDNSAPEGVQPPDAGSDASLDVTVLGSQFIDNGNDPVRSVSDRDGLRVDEGGLGDLEITIRLSRFQGNGADGVEVDERSTGDIRVDTLLSLVAGNGEFDPEDLDDGFDIDEWNEGSIIGRIVSSAALNNWEEGFDVNENNLGDLRVDMLLVTANGNREEAIDYEEDDDFAGGGDLTTTMTGITANGNGADGGDGAVKIREKGTGNLDATLSLVETTGNLYAGIHIREDADGEFDAAVRRANASSNTAGGIHFEERGTGNLEASVAIANASNNVDGIFINERDAGDLAVSVANSSLSNNTDDGVDADEDDAGAGTLQLTNVTLTGNGDQASALDDVVIVP